MEKLKDVKLNKELLSIEPNEKVELPDTVENPFLVKREDDTQLQKAIELLK